MGISRLGHRAANFRIDCLYFGGFRLSEATFFRGKALLLQAALWKRHNYAVLRKKQAEMLRTFRGKKKNVKGAGAKRGNTGLIFRRKQI